MTSLTFWSLGGAKHARSGVTIPLVRIRFEYVNWRGVRHEYVIDVESVEWGRYDSNGSHQDSPYNWVLNGEVVTRDGDPREDMGTRRRTFLLDEIKQLEVVQ